MHRLKTQATLLSPLLDEKTDLSVAVIGLLQQLQKQLTLCQELSKLIMGSPSELPMQLRVLLQHLKVLLLTVERRLITVEQTSKIFAAVMPVTKILLTHGYGNLALVYHDYFIKLSDQFPEASKNYLGEHFAERAKLKTQVFNDHCDEKSSNISLASSSMILSALRDLHYALQIAIKKKDLSTIQQRKKELNELEAKFHYQIAATIWVHQQRHLTMVVSDEKNDASLISGRELQLSKALKSIVSYFIESQSSHPFAWNLLFLLQQDYAYKSIAWQELLLSLLLQASQHDFFASDSSIKLKGEWQRYELQLTLARRRLAVEMEKKSLTFESEQSVMTNYSARIKTLLTKMFEDCSQFLGPSPLGLKFCFVALGSLARQEVLPYSDVELFCLLDKAEHSNWEEGSSFENRYLHAWYEFFLFKMASLGEFTGFRLDGDAFNAGHPLNPEFRGRASHLINHHLEKNFAKPNSLALSFLMTDYLYGDKSLYLDYQSQLKQYLAQPSAPLTIKQKWAIAIIKADLLQFSDKEPKAGSVINIKKNYWHPFTQSLQALAQYYTHEHIITTSTAIMALKNAKLLTPIIAKEYQQAYLFLYRLRWQLHQQAAEQAEEFEVKNISLKPIISQLKQIYHRILLPLQQTLTLWLNTQKWEIDPLQIYVNSLLEKKLIFQKNILHTIAYTAVTRSMFDGDKSKWYDYHKKIYQKLARSNRSIYLRLLAAEHPQDSIQSNQLINYLTIIPDSQGWRVKKDTAEKEWRQKLKDFFTTPAKSGADFCILSENFQSDVPGQITRYELPPGLREQLLTVESPGKWQFKSKPEKQPGRHVVLEIKTTRHKFAAKIIPEQPGTEEVVRILAERVSGEEILPNCLIGLQDREGNTFSIQLFPYLDNTQTHHLDRILVDYPDYLNHLEPDCFTRLLLRVLLINPEDDKADDYIILPVLQKNGSVLYRIVRIDNERAFFPIEEVKSGDSFLARSRKVLLVKSILYCLNQMQEPLNSTVIDEFLELEPYALLSEWLEILHARHQCWNALFDDKSIRQQATYVDPKTDQPMPGFPVVMLPPDIEKELLNRLTLMQYQLRQYRQSQVTAKAVKIIDLSGLALLRTVQPLLASYYESTFKNSPYDPEHPELALNRFSYLVDDKKNPLYQKTSLGHHQSGASTVTAITQSLRLAIRFSVEDILAIKKGEHLSCMQAKSRLISLGADKALPFIKTSLLQQHEPAIKIFQDLCLRQQILLIDEFHQALVESKSQCYTAKQQQFLLRAYRNTPFTRLALFPFYQVLTAEYLIPLLKSSGEHLNYLNLSHCKQLKESILGTVSLHCPNLRELILKNLPWLVLEKDNGLVRANSALVFLELRRLDLSYSTQIKRVWIESPLSLKDITQKKSNPQLDIILKFNNSKSMIKGNNHKYQDIEKDSLMTEVKSTKEENILTTKIEILNTKAAIQKPKSTGQEDILPPKMETIKKENSPTSEVKIINPSNIVMTGIQNFRANELIKIVCIGKTPLKSDILNSFKLGHLTRNRTALIGAEFITKNILINGAQKKLQIWDTAEQEIFDSIRAMYFKNSSIVLLFSCDEEGSLLKDIYGQYQNSDANPLPPFILVDISTKGKYDPGNKVFAQTKAATAYYQLSMDFNLITGLFDLVVKVIDQPFSFWDDSAENLQSMDQMAFQAMIHLALMYYDNQRIVQYLRMRAIDWELPGPNERTLFLQAGYYGHTEWLQEFIKLYNAEALWMQRDRDNQSIIHMALSVISEHQTHYDKVINFVLEQKAADFKCRGKNGRTIFLEAAYRQRLDWMQKFLMLKDPKLLWSQRDADGKTIMHYALDSGDEKIRNAFIEFMIKENQIDFLARGQKGQTVFLEAAKQRRIDWVKRFLTLAKDPKLLWSQCDNDGQTVVHYALQHNLSELIELAITQKEINFIAQGKYNRTVFLEAAKQKRIEWVKRFPTLTDPKLLWSQRDKMGQSIVHYALNCSDDRIRNAMIQFVVEQKQIDFIARGQDGRTVFLEAAKEAHVDWMEYFLTLADPNLLWSQCDNNNHSAIDLAKDIIKRDKNCYDAPAKNAKKILELHEQYQNTKKLDKTTFFSLSQELIESKKELSSLPIFLKTAALSPKTLALRDEKNKVCHFWEIKTQADGNGLFETALLGLQALRPAALQCFEIENPQELRSFTAEQLDQQQYRAANDLGNYRRLLALLLKNQILDALPAAASSEPKENFILGYSPKIYKTLLSLGEEYLETRASLLSLSEESLASIISKDQDSIIELLENSFSVYIEHLSRNLDWGGEIEMCIISQLFKIRIVVYKENHSKPIASFGNYRDAIYFYHRNADSFYHLLIPEIPGLPRRYSLFASNSSVKAPFVPQIKDDMDLSSASFRL